MQRWPITRDEVKVSSMIVGLPETLIETIRKSASRDGVSITKWAELMLTAATKGQRVELSYSVANTKN